MNDPQRLVAMHPSSRVRRELRAGAELAPPAGAERAVWVALNASITVSVPTANPVTGAAATSAGGDAGVGAEDASAAHERRV
jgi:hypothetical protein